MRVFESSGLQNWNKAQLKRWIKKAAPWTLFLCLPILVSASLWSVVVRPTFEQLHETQKIEKLLSEKPEMESLLQESRTMLGRWNEKEMKTGEPEVLLNRLKQYAEDHRTLILDMRVGTIYSPGKSGKKPQLKESALGQMTHIPVSIKVQGSYNKIASWIYSTEETPGMIIKDFSIEPSTKSGSSCLLTANLMMLVKP